MDFGLGLLRTAGIDQAEEVGLFACMVIKKCRYWPAMVPGDEFLLAFNEAQVGASMAIAGVLDGVKYFLWGLK